MSEILIASSENQVVPDTDERKAKQLPQPVTYHLLCMVPEAQQNFENGIAKSTKTMIHEEILSPVLFVMDMGPDCYKDTTRFPSGPSCKVGDFIMTRPGSGSRIKIHGKEFRIINDDAVEAVVEDPRGIARA